MTNISKGLRSRLEETARVDHLVQARTQVSKDRTTKYLFELEDGHFIETVLIPERGHFTLCVSFSGRLRHGVPFLPDGEARAEKKSYGR